MKKRVLIFFFLLAFLLVGCSSGQSGEITLPKELNAKTKETFSSGEQRVIKDYISALVEAYNRGDEETYMKTTAKYDNAFSKISALAQTNDELSELLQKGFTITMSASMGMVGPGESSSSTNVRGYLKSQINELIATYYEVD